MVYNLQIENSDICTQYIEDIEFYMRQYGGPFGFKDNKQIPIHFVVKDTDGVKYDGRYFIGYANNITITQSGGTSRTINITLVFSDDKYDILVHMINCQRRMTDPNYNFTKTITVEETKDYRMSIDIRYINKLVVKS